MTSITSTRKVAVPTAGSRIWTNGSLSLIGSYFWRRGNTGQFKAGSFGPFFAPRGGIGEAVLQFELALQKLVYAAHDVGDDRLRCIEDTALNLLFSCDRIPRERVHKSERRCCLRIAIIEIAENRIQMSVAAVQKRRDLLDA